MGAHIAILQAISIIYRCDFRGNSKRRRSVATIVGSGIRATIYPARVGSAYGMTRRQHLLASKLAAEDVGILLDAVASVSESVAAVVVRRG